MAMSRLVGTIFRVLLALGVAGLATALVYCGVFVQPKHYVQLLIVMSPVVFFLSIAIGGPLYAVLVKLGIRLTMPICIAAGFAVGALPGILFWAIATSPSSVFPMPENLAEENVRLPFIFGAFGAIGGLVFAFVGRALKLR